MISIAERVKAMLTRRHDFTTTFSTPHGERVLQEIYSYGGLLNAAPKENLERFEGRRDMALHIAEILRMTPAEIRRIVQPSSSIEGDYDE